MSRTNPTVHEVDELAVPCPLCGAEPGVWCHVVSRPDYWTIYLHGPRYNAVAETR